MLRILGKLSKPVCENCPDGVVEQTIFPQKLIKQIQYSYFVDKPGGLILKNNVDALTHPIII